MRIDAPRLVSPSLDDLVVAGPELAFDPNGTDGVQIEGAEWQDRRLSGVTFRETHFDRAHAAGVRLPDCRFLDVRFTALDCHDVTAPGSTWRDSEIVESRLGSAVLSESQISSLRIERCKIGYLGFAAAEVLDLLIDGCTLDELDLSDSQCTRVAIRDTRLGLLRVAGARLRHVDLREARLGSVTPVSGLRGAALTVAQVLDLAGELAAEAGILVD